MSDDINYCINCRNCLFEEEVRNHERFCCVSCELEHGFRTGGKLVPAVPPVVKQEFPAASPAAIPVAPLPHDYRIPVLPTESEARKALPIFSGVLNYFPLAVAAVARVSQRGNDKHNPGESLRWARGKSMDHADCIARHLIDVETVDPITGEYEDAQAMAWRAMAKLEELEERRLGKPISRGSSPDSAALANGKGVSQ